MSSNKQTIAYVIASVVTLLLASIFWRFQQPYANEYEFDFGYILASSLWFFCICLFLSWTLMSFIWYAVSSRGDLKGQKALHIAFASARSSWIMIAVGYFVQDIIYPWPTNWPNHDLAITLYGHREFSADIAIDFIYYFIPFALLLIALMIGAFVTRAKEKP